MPTLHHASFDPEWMPGQTGEKELRSGIKNLFRLK